MYRLYMCTCKVHMCQPDNGTVTETFSLYINTCTCAIFCHGLSPNTTPTHVGGLKVLKTLTIMCHGHLPALKIQILPHGSIRLPTQDLPRLDWLKRHQ